MAADGLSFRLHLRRGVRFHDGTPVTSDVIRKILLRRLPSELGPAYSDIASIEAPSDYELEFNLRRRSNFVLESLAIPIEAPSGDSVGTGPFYAAARSDNQVEMQANPSYYGGKPIIDRIVIRSYSSVRAAWADMLRGSVDMLYDVGVDMLDSLQPSNDVEIFTYQRPYVFLLIPNVRRPPFVDAAVRRHMNAAIDRGTLAQHVFRGRAIPADSAVLPSHWAFDSKSPRFLFEPVPIAPYTTVQATCLFADASLERLAIALQQQLRAVGVQMTLEFTSVDRIYERIGVGDFDVILADAIHGPTLLRPYLFWHSGGQFNWGKFSSKAVDAALDAIRGAASDDEYRAGVAAFQRAIVEDPPAIFLAWSERARAVSTRFEVPVEPGRDILSTLRLWRPVPSDN